MERVCKSASLYSWESIHKHFSFYAKVLLAWTVFTFINTATPAPVFYLGFIGILRDKHKVTHNHDNKERDHDGPTWFCSVI